MYAIVQVYCLFGPDMSLGCYNCARGIRARKGRHFGECVCCQSLVLELSIFLELRLGDALKYGMIIVEAFSMISIDSGNK